MFSILDADQFIEIIEQFSERMFGRVGNGEYRKS